jgi:hypothetical protein
MTPEVIQRFIDSGHEVFVTWDDGEDRCVTVCRPDHIDGDDLVTLVGNRIPIDSITSIARADAFDHLRGAR